MEGAIQTAPMEKWANIVRTMEVHPAQVGTYVQQGWVILIAYMRRTDIPDQQMQNGCIAYTTKQVYEPVVLIGLTNIETLCADLKEAQSELARLRSMPVECEKLKTTVTALERETRILAERATGLVGDLEAERKSHYALQAANRKLEGDIGKLRRALGELRMKEILSEGIPATS
jgi:UDP-N-acetylmuramyl tripeptide synthase